MTEIKAIRDGKTNSAKPVPEHESYGGAERDSVAGGPVGRGNFGGATADPGASWSGGRPSADDDAPVTPDSGNKNPFSPR